MEIYLPPPQHLYICVLCGICARAMLLSNCQRQEYGKRKFIYVCIGDVCGRGARRSEISSTAAGEQNRRMNNSKGGAQLMLINNTRSGRHSQLRPNWNPPPPPRE